MSKLIFIILFLVMYVNLHAQSESPHGEDFKMQCDACHTSDSWEIPHDLWKFEEVVEKNISGATGWEMPIDNSKFNHNNTEFSLVGQHENVDCRLCHESLVFSEADVDCKSCHIDPHKQTVGFDCARCHGVENWAVDNIAELHNENGFPLLGMHALSNCAECHLNESTLAFEPIGNECVNCHTEDFVSTTLPNHSEAGFSMNCIECHSIDATDWSSQEFNHDFFPLTGGHNISECTQCHENDDFTNTPTECIACHTFGFNQTNNPNHIALGLSNDCIECHTTEPGWEPASFDIHDEFYTLNGAHATISNECVACHDGDYNSTLTTCAGCHTEDYQQTTNPNHTEAQFPMECESCHSEISWVPASFDHDEFYPLTGAHVMIANECADCHHGDYNNTPNTCVGCHTEDFNQTVNPNHNTLGLSTDCQSCHTTEPDWMPASFDVHDEYYMLNGAHAAIANDCATCHDGDYNSTPTTCVGCHTEDYQQTTNPNHTDAQFPMECESCHSEISWVPSSFDHDEFYPLTGAHASIANECADCHHGDYNNTPNTCVGCHTEDFNQTVNPNHNTLGLSTDCQSCHTTQPDWMPASFDVHDEYYMLNGAHATIANDCAACHNGDYMNTPTTCFGCHADDYQETSNPNHSNAGFTTDCQSCHNESDWSSATFDHDGQYFPIYSGTHAGEWTDCIDCHQDPSNYSEFTCTTCHSNPETDNDHAVVGGYSYDSPACLACHPAGEADDVFDHNLTNFPLTGAHITTECLECHSNGYEVTPTECIACHTVDYNQTTNPNHTALGLSNDCIECHTTEPGWEPASFDIHDEFYTLNGAHATISNECVACHDGDYNSTPTTCVGCHTEDYQQTTNPNHTDAQFPMECESCHSEISWVPSSFDHDEFYPLTGAHASIANECADCHHGDYNNTPNTCVGCHTEDFNQTVNPNHNTLGLSTDCQSCHTTQPDWMPASFDVHDEYYMLNGAHASIANDCAACHNGDYTNTPTTCFGCHADDYQETTNPNHSNAGFTTDCQSCHNESDWSSATFDHDGQYFPIYSGTHAGEWTDCIDCHQDPTNYAEFTCTTCHSNPETDNDHAVVGGYSYDSPACLACHPAGEADDVFDHNLTNFPLTGAHITTECLDCHSNGYEGTPTECIACHTVDFNQTTNPNHTALGLSNDCIECHTTEPGWEPASFDIHDEFYTLNGAHATISNECVACHDGDYNSTPTTCAGCHTEDYQQTTNPNHTEAQFPMECESCHSEISWVPASFDHDEFYPLTGAHATIANECADCHHGDYNNTPNTCVGCHTEDFNQTVNPNHNILGLSTDCQSCHTTQPDWMPASFDVHDEYYMLNGAHAAIANDCAACHNGDYTNTPTTCFGCHADDYQETSNPNHSNAGFTTDCQSCHNESDWSSATFDHDGQYFPIYSGTHAGEWTDCIDCHQDPSNYAEFTCTTCHSNPETDNDHAVVGGYSYDSPACLACHPAGEADDVFDHNMTNFPLTGAHITTECLECHSNGYEGTPTECMACHANDFNQTTNPNHTALGLSNDCIECHTTEPGWEPASFDIHDEFYTLNGAHATISNECVACHEGDYNSTPTTCTGCHTEDYNQTTNPNHTEAQFPMECESCHSEISWVPASFDHDEFYPLTGAHVMIANECADCHHGDYNNTPNTCVGCHTEDFNQTVNPNHNTLGLSTDCQSCHTTQPDWMPASFDVHDEYYMLNGAHAAMANDCAACHNGDYTNTPTTCFGCHADDYQDANNPNHLSAGFPTDCQSCHNEVAWDPSSFDHNNMYFPIYSGNHRNEWNQCSECHTVANNFSLFSCIDCHEHNDPNELADDHEDENGYSYNSTACYSCHPNGDD